MSNLFQVYVWVVIYPVAWIWTGLVSIIIIILSFINAGRWAGIYIAPLWGKFILFISGTRVNIKGLPHIKPDQSYVVVANHQSTYDILVVYGYMPLDFKWVIKKELRKLPFVGYACHKMGHIFVDRSNREASIAAMKEAKKRLVHGTSVFFFPEGTRSNGKDLKPFKKGAFKMAKDLGLPILPLSIANANQVMPSQSLRIVPGVITLTFHEPIGTEIVERESLTALMLEAQKMVGSSV